MPMVFPTSPVVGQVFSSGGRSWVWNGSTWDSPRTDNPPLAIPTGNAIINGAFDIWQRGTSFVGSPGGYGADRWSAYRSGATGSTFSRQPANLAGFQFCQRVQRDSGNTSTVSIWTFQSMETVASIPFAGTSVTFSFYAKAGANFSSASNILNFGIYSGTGTDQNLGLAYTGATQPVISTATLTTSWQRFTVTGTIPANATEITPYVNYSPTGTAGANDWFEITGVQLEAGAVATPFRRNAPSIQAELAACQRYYWRLSSTGFSYIAMNQSRGGSFYSLGNIIALPVAMRAIPSISINNLGVEPPPGGTAALTTTATNYSTVNNIGFWTTRVSGTWATDGPGMLVLIDSTSFVQASAEL